MKTAWVFLGILTPELVLFISFQQYLEARKTQTGLYAIQTTKESLAVLHIVCYQLNRT